MVLTFKKILVPVDNSEHSRNALRYALGLAQTQGSYVALLHCFGRIPLLIGGEPRRELVRELVRESEKLLAPYAKKMRDLDLEPVLIIKEGRAGEVIVQEAKSGDYDLIVMGSRGLTDVQGLIMGSDAHRVLSAAHCPVLITR
ncbi:MAG: universal stress protein [Humidesulfovibrio sp.]|uniref:universal stress protein n=1 Tax=Humidesulfovibrio sp. TaxID=2910988 RepID=UPI002735E16F|nr:universal stress protein [Humidesulfovibrio sp.]MDP2847378.1 universal stress protein [Humidesulfovibrio sp.]